MTLTNAKWPRSLDAGVFLLLGCTGTGYVTYGPGQISRKHFTGAGYAVERGEAIATRNGYKLIE